MKSADELVKLMNKRIPDNVAKAGAGSLPNPWDQAYKTFRHTMDEAIKANIPPDQTLDSELIAIAGRYGSPSPRFEAITRAIEKGWNEARFRVVHTPKTSKTKITPVTTITLETP